MPRHRLTRELTWILLAKLLGLTLLYLLVVAPNRVDPAPRIAAVLLSPFTPTR